MGSISALITRGYGTTEGSISAIITRGFIASALPPSIELPPPSRIFVLPRSQPSVGNKTPLDVINFGMDWTSDLNGDTITTESWSVDEGTTSIVRQGIIGDVAVVYLQQGAAGESGVITNTVQTVGGLYLQASFTLYVNQFNT